ncbi:MAG: PEP-CTERM sorting domain-containing protein [Rhodospirillales bacterium]
MNVTFIRQRAVAAIAGLALLASGGFVTDAKAIPTTYTISGTLDWTNTDHDSIDGTVTYNLVGNVATLNVTIAKISGGGNGQETGTWNGSGIYAGSDGPTTLFSQAGPANLYLNFAVDLKLLPATETLSAAAWICGAHCRLDTTAIAVTASSAPEPTSLAILGTGLAYISLAGRSRFRRTRGSSLPQMASPIYCS